MIPGAIQAREELMAATSHVYAGAARSMEGTLGGFFRQAVGDDRWEHLTNGLPDDTQVHAITVHPDNPDGVYIGHTTRRLSQPGWRRQLAQDGRPRTSARPGHHGFSVPGHAARRRSQFSGRR